MKKPINPNMAIPQLMLVVKLIQRLVLVLQQKDKIQQPVAIVLMQKDRIQQPVVVVLMQKEVIINHLVLRYGPIGQFQYPM